MRRQAAHRKRRDVVHGVVKQDTRSVCSARLAGRAVWVLMTALLLSAGCGKETDCRALSHACAPGFACKPQSNDGQYRCVELSENRQAQRKTPAQRGKRVTPKGSVPTVKVEERADKKTFQQEIRFQVELMKKGDVDKLKDRFTERQRNKITKKMLEKAVKEVGNYSIEELVHIVEPGRYKGQLTAKIKMKNGRTLTTFRLVAGRWQAGTLWFK